MANYDTQKGMIDLQRGYWNGLATGYQAQMHITMDDFHYGPQIHGERELGLLPRFTPDMRALELGCGAAQNSVWLARQGVECTAVDLATAQLRHARVNARKSGVKIRFLSFPIEQLSQRIRSSFDFIHSSHAMEFVANPAVCVAQMAKRLRPGGTLMISTVHPLYNGDWVEQMSFGGQPGEMGIFLTNYFKPPDDVRRRGRKVEVVSRAYPLSAWFRWLRTAGLEVTHLEEPAAVPDNTPAPYSNRDWAHHDGQLHATPATVIFVARRPEDGT